MASLSAGLQGQLLGSVGTLRVQQPDTTNCGRSSLSGESVAAAAATPSAVQQTVASASRAGCWSSSAGLRHNHQQQQPGHPGLVQQRSFFGGESVRAMFSVSRFPASSSTLAACQSLSRHAASPLTVCQSIPRNASTSTSAGAAIPATTPATTAGGSSGSSTSSSAVVSPERSASSFTQPAAAAAYNFDEDTLSEDDEDVRLFDSDVDSDDEDDDVKEVVHVDAAQEPGDELRVTNLGLSEVIVKGLQRRGIDRLFPIQHAVMRPSMEGRDIIARAKTGTGKTLAFGIPILERIVREQKEMGSRMSRNPRCLVLAPTRELAKQVEREFMETLPPPTLRTVCVYGGVSIEAQIKELRRGVDCVVGTPGRIIDLIDRGSLKLADVQYVVLDEADQMLAVGFEEDVERIMEGLPGQEERQTCLFSATMPGWVRKLSRKYLNNPLTIDLVGEQEDKIAENIRLMCVRTPNSAKKRILTDLIAVHGKNAKTIVFTQTKRDADEVAESLSAFAGCEALHGDIAQQQRERTLQSFRDGRFSVLVATDVAARGLDIPNVDLVIHYEIPNDPETFVHRSGRTGRAGKSGSAILMYTDSQTRTLRLIERDVGHKLDRISPPHVDEVLRASADRAVEAIESVHPELADVFMEAAEKLLADKGPLALAAAIAHVSGFNKPPACKSLLTHEEGFVTVRIVRTPRSRNPPLATPRSVLGTLSEIYRPAADSVGKIRMLRRGTDEGAVFDLPEAVAKELLRIDITNGDVLDVPKELPAIEEDEREREGDRYGRRDRGGRDRGGRGGSFRDSGRDRDDKRGGGRFGDRGGFRSDMDRVSRGGDRFGDRDDGFRTRSSGGDRERSGRAPLRRSLSTSSSNSSSIGVWSRDAEGAGGFSSGDSDRDSWSSPADWSGSRTGGRLERRDEGGYERGRRVVGGAGGGGRSGGFGGVCFLCKQPGHRAADCPMVGGS